MKTTFLAAIIIGIMLTGAATIAQPTLTSAGLNPVISETVTYYTSAYLDPGDGGANQVWNLNFTNSTSGGLSTCVTPISTPKGSSFPNANLAINNPKTSTVVYYKTSGTAFQSYGTIGGTAQTLIIYSDPEDLLRFPFTWDDTYTDYWATKFVSAGSTYYRTGTTTVTADGYGKVTTPAGTFTDVLRVHFVQEYQDSTQVSGDPFIIEYVNDQYMWYKEGVHFAIASVFELSSDVGFYEGGNYSTSTVGLNQFLEQNPLVNAYPNPFNETINIDLPESGPYIIYSVDGREVMKGELAFGNNQISTSDLAKGSYLLNAGNKTVLLVK